MFAGLTVGIELRLGLCDETLVYITFGLDTT